MIALGFLILGSQGISAQTTATPIQQARAALPAAYRTTFNNIIKDAQSRGLPIEPLADKVLEGIAKGHPASRIIPVLRLRVEQLARAKQLLGARPAASDVIAVADVLQRGLSDQTIKKVKESARPNEPFGLSLATFADLAERGVSPDVALEMINGWRSRGAVPGELRELPAAVERLVRSGANPVRAGSAVADALRSGRGAGSVRMDSKLRAQPGSPNTEVRSKPVSPSLTPSAPPPGAAAAVSRAKKRATL